MVGTMRLPGRMFGMGLVLIRVIKTMIEVCW
jgi:hypothetical protein